MGEAALKVDQEFQTDTREAPRAAVYASVDLFSEHNFWSGLTMNMSEGGLFVATHHSVPVGNDPIVTLVEVRWTRSYSGQEDVPPGLGLQFIDTDAAALAKIRQFVSTIREPLFYED
jgi:Tfp pilus assembly protein PilZ